MAAPPAGPRPFWKRRPFRYGAIAAALLGGNWIYDHFSHFRGGARAVDAFTDTPGLETGAAWSPDGRRVAFVWRTEGNGTQDRIYMKPAAGGAAVPLTHGPGQEWSPVWSPDGRRIAFARVEEAGHAFYYVVPASGGAERALAEFDESPGEERLRPALSWLPDGRRLAVVWKPAGQPAAIFVLDGATGKLARLTSPPARSAGDGSPRVSPDGRTVAFVRDAGGADLYLASLGGGAERRLTFDGKNIEGLAWTRDGREIVYAAPRLGPFHLWRVAAAGGTPRDLDFAGDGARYPALNRAGQLVFTREAADANIWRVDLRDPQHHAQRLIASPRREFGAQYAPDGRRIAFISDRSGSEQLWVCDSEGRNPVRLTSFPAASLGLPRWSPDGRRIAFEKLQLPAANIYVIPAAGGTPKEITASNVSWGRSPNWSHNGQWIYFYAPDRLWKMPSSGGVAQPVTRRGGLSPFESPDGQSVYYYWVGRIWKTAADGSKSDSDFPRPADWPLWSLGPGGLYYLDEDRLSFYDFTARQTRELCTVDRGPRRSRTFALSPDARYFLYSKPEPTTDLMLTAFPN